MEVIKIDFKKVRGMYRVFSLIYVKNDKNFCEIVK